jgi:hypothetical protein
MGKAHHKITLHTSEHEQGSNSLFSRRVTNNQVLVFRALKKASGKNLSEKVAMHECMTPPRMSTANKI